MSEQLTVAALTEGVVDGSGILDILIKTIKAHLGAEYSAGRLTGDQYTKALIAGMETATAGAVQYSLQYLVANQNIQLLEQQKELMAQKVITEKFQTQSVVDGVDIDGILGKQSVLYTNQANGYIRDAEQKAAKILMDSMNTRITMDVQDDTEELDATLTGFQLKDVFNALRSGVGVANQ